jgi:hypothetical protein
VKGRTPTAEELRVMDAIGSLGCLACAKDGNANPWISLHHIDGKTKPDAHKKVIGLCAGHHQDGTGNDKSMIAVHPWKSQFEARYGSQYDLLAGAMKQLGLNK